MAKKKVNETGKGKTNGPPESDNPKSDGEQSTETDCSGVFEGFGSVDPDAGEGTDGDDAPDDSGVISKYPEPLPQTVPAIPLSEGVSGSYASRNIQVNTRHGENHHIIAKRLFIGLHKRNEKLKSGKHVGSVADAMRWILELVDDHGQIVVD